MNITEIIDKYVIGRSFLTSYGNQKIYRIEEVDLKLTPESKFPNEKFKTFTDYFFKQYNVKIEDKKQFLLVAKRRKTTVDKNGNKIQVVEDIHLVPELLKPTGMTDEMKNDFKCMRAIADYTQMTPSDRDLKQTDLAKQLNKTANEIGLEIDATSNVIRDALIYDPPKIQMKKSFTPEGSGTFRIKDPIYSQDASLGKWVIICDQRDREAVDIIALHLLKSSKSINIKVPKPNIIEIKTGKNDPLPTAQVMSIISKTNQADIFLLAFQKRTADQLYKKVKTECNQKYGKPTQFFANWNPKNDKTLTNLSVLSNVVIQMACKLGYFPWKVELPYKLNDNGR